MRAGVILPGGTATEQLDLAVAAEAAGWDAVLTWETGYGVDPWTVMAAMAVRTERVRLGTMLTPAPWRRPWKLAGQVATLDQLSGGRAFVTLGVGALSDDLTQTGEVTDLRERAERMDEAIDVMRSLWTGDGEHHGTYYDVTCSAWLREAVRPVQSPPPIWVAAAWPRPKSMRRVLRCDGVSPEYHLDGREATPDDLRAMREWLAGQGAPDSLDVVTEGETSPEDPDSSAAVAGWAEAGATWWLESRWGGTETIGARLADTRRRIDAGPPVA
jgi:hypothetical protein